MRALAWGLRLTVLCGLILGWSLVAGFHLPGWVLYPLAGLSQLLLFGYAPSPLARLMIPLAWLAGCCSPPLGAMLGLAYLLEIARQLDLELPRNRLSSGGSWLGVAILTAAATLLSAMVGCELIYCVSGSVTIALGILALRDLSRAVLDSIRAVESSQSEQEWNGYSRY